jgi:two-component system CheB/CheR fusion protein
MAPATSVEVAPRAQPQDYVTPPFLVAAVGASAGGIEAFTAMVQDIPDDAPLAIVLAQHLSRDRPSALADVLDKRIALRVTQATDRIRVEPGRVYVIPPGKHMTVIDGHLRISPRPEDFWPRQVDALFHSVAKFYRDKAVGIILSGALSDGAEGFVEINAVGGITIAQLPDEAQHGSMPQAAIATGDTDLVLPVKEIGRELIRIADWPRFKRTRPRHIPADPIEPSA